MTKTKSKLKSILFATLLTQMFNIASAEQIGKHPRVAELEDSLRDAASNYLRSRFPDRPFLVNVSVDALRRGSAITTTDTKEALPYYDSGSADEIQDEWDDPQIGLHQLILRTNKVTLQISLKDSLNDSETAEVKEALFKSLHLIPARDEIQLSFRAWTNGDRGWFYPVLGIVLACIFLAGFFLIQRSSVGKLTHAMKETGKSSSNGAGATAMPLAVSSTPGGQTGTGENKTNVRGGVSVSDPFKAREIVTRYIQDLTSRKTFPSLKTMIRLDDYGHKNPSGLGGLLSEFKPEYRNRLFTLSSHEGWLEALNHPGLMTLEEVELIQLIARENDTERSPELEEVLIKIWRLGDQLPDFIRTYPKEVIFGVLSQLPKNMGIKAARKAMPGAWADLLDPDFSPKTLDAKTIEELSKKAEETLPLQSLNHFKRHRNESELREFLLIANPEEEREIYMASRHDSTIHKNRAPFYVIFDQPDAGLEDFVQHFNPEQWALALFNIPKTERLKVQKRMNEKQSFLFIEHLKRFDQIHPDLTQIGQCRENIAQSLKKYLVSQQATTDSVDATDSTVTTQESVTKIQAQTKTKPKKDKAA